MQVLSGTIDLTKLYATVQAMPGEYKRARTLAFKEIGDGLLKERPRPRPCGYRRVQDESWFLKMADDRRCVVETPKRKLFTILEYQGSVNPT